MSALTGLASLILSFILSVAYGAYYARKAESFARMLCKTSSILLLAVFAALFAAPVVLVAALLASATGDFFLSRTGTRNFLAGMAAFFLAHVAYIGLFAQLGGTFEVLLDRWMWAVMLIFAAMAMASWLSPKLGKLKVPVLAYIVVICAMGLAALALPVHAGHLMVMGGAAAFIISDAVLSIELFVLSCGARSLRVTPYIVWTFYWSAQVLIVLGVLGAPV